MFGEVNEFDPMSSCQTFEERMAANLASPCADPFRPVFPDAVAGYVAPAILFLGTTIIGYGLSTGRKWALSNFVNPSNQLAIMLLLMVCDHASSFWDHSRISDEEYCLTAFLTSDTVDDVKGRLVFGGLGALLAAVSAYGVSRGSISLAATRIPFTAIMMYLCWSPQKFQSCRSNGLVTGGLAFGLDIMTLVGILETLRLRDNDWHAPTVAYSAVISALFVVLIGRHSDYGQRVKAGSCAIDDEADVAAEKLVDRRPELYTGIAMSVASIVFILYLKAKYSDWGAARCTPR